MFKKLLAKALVAALTVSAMFSGVGVTSEAKISDATDVEVAGTVTGDPGQGWDYDVWTEFSDMSSVISSSTTYKDFVNGATEKTLKFSPTGTPKVNQYKIWEDWDNNVSYDPPKVTDTRYYNEINQHFLVVVPANTILQVSDTSLTGDDSTYIGIQDIAEIGDTSMTIFPRNVTPNSYPQIINDTDSEKTFFVNIKAKNTVTKAASQTAAVIKLSVYKVPDVESGSNDSTDLKYAKANMLKALNKKKINIISNSSEYEQILTKYVYKKYPKYKSKINFINLMSICNFEERPAVLIFALKQKGYKIIVNMDEAYVSPNKVLEKETYNNDGSSDMKYSAVKNADADTLKGLLAPTTDLGISDEMYKNAYGFTKVIGSDKKGVQKALAYYVCPGSLFVNKKVAKKVLGTTDANTISKKVSTWKGFLSVAETAKKKGVYMTSDYGWIRQIYGSQKNCKIDFESYKKKYCRLDGTWSEGWQAGMSDGNVLCYFGTTWMNYSINEKEDWIVVNPPTAFYWGGVYIGANKACKGDKMVTNILKLTCCDEKTMYKFATEMCVVPNNTKSVAKAIKNKVSLYGDRYTTASNGYFSMYDKTAKNLGKYFKFPTIKYNVKFSANGGKGKMGKLSKKTYGKSFKLPSNKFTRKGYKFVGWSTTKKGKVVYKNKASVKNLLREQGGTVTLYAQWKKK